MIAEVHDVWPKRRGDMIIIDGAINQLSPSPVTDLEYTRDIDHASLSPPAF
jgi:hypothetical protein